MAVQMHQQQGEEEEEEEEEVFYDKVKLRREQRKRRISQLKKRKTLREAAKLASNVNRASHVFNQTTNEKDSQQVASIAHSLESSHLQTFLDDRKQRRMEE